MPFVFLLTIGAVDFGRMWTVSTRISDAAYAGAAYGAQTAETAKDTLGIRNVVLHQLGVVSADSAALRTEASTSQSLSLTRDVFGAAKGGNGNGGGAGSGGSSGGGTDGDTGGDLGGDRGGDTAGKTVTVDDYEILVDRYCRCDDDSPVNCDTGTCTAGNASRRTYVHVRIGTNFTTIFDYPGIPPVIALEREARLRAR